jgi:hypothetical protein
VTAIAVSPCGRFVASASIGNDENSSVLLAWRLEDGEAADFDPSGKVRRKKKIII